MNKPLKVGITHGDINGIGYEVVLKALADERITEICTPVLFGSSKLVNYYRKVFDLEEPAMNICSSVEHVREHEVNLVNIITEEVKVDMGLATEESGKAALRSLQAAADALAEGQIDVLVTAPINKAAIHSDEFPFAGHTEFLTSRFSAEDALARGLMILYKDGLRVALATNHLAVKDIPAAITKELVVEKLRSFDHSLRKDFGIGRPTIAVLSLNPHAGDGGLLGREEAEVIKPAIDEVVANGLVAFGPFAADGFFGTEAYKNYDGILAMYHDQGLAPFKTLVAGEGVNFTAGLPVVRTSPDHGTGYDIAGRGLADPTSLRNAIYEAIDIHRRRAAWDYARRNPLRKQYVERGADKTVDLSKED